MIFGYQLGWIHIMYGGILVFGLVVFEMLVGMRKIKFKGRTHMKVHKWTAWALVLIAAGHGVLATIIYNGWKIG